MSTLYSAQELTVLSDFLHFPSLAGNKVIGGELFLLSLLTVSDTLVAITNLFPSLSGELSFVYFYLRDYSLRDVDACNELIEKILRMFQSLPQTLKLSPMLAQTKMLALLYFLNELIASVR